MNNAAVAVGVVGLAAVIMNLAPQLATFTVEIDNAYNSCGFTDERLIYVLNAIIQGARAIHRAGIQAFHAGITFQGLLQARNNLTAYLINYRTLSLILGGVIGYSAGSPNLIPLLALAQNYTNSGLQVLSIYRGLEQATGVAINQSPISPVAWGA